MKKKLFYVGIDVDQNSFSVAIIDIYTNQETFVKCSPNAPALISKLQKIANPEEFDICYEATYLGFNLQRILSKNGFKCAVVSPSMIPEIKGKKVKTDKIDAKRLAEYHMKGLLTEVHVPDEKLEMDRALIRSRTYLSKQVAALRRHILSICQRIGWDFRQETSLKSYWTIKFKNWLETKISKSSDSSLKVNLKLLLRQLLQNEQTLDLYDSEIKNLSESSDYKKKTAALVCYRGLDTISAMGVVTEIGDINRFDHPKRLASYSGLDIREYSSGGRELKFNISKCGNKHLRTLVNEACQFAIRPPRIGQKLKQRRKHANIKQIEIADRCMNRLYKKSTRLLYKDKPRNKIKIACAREMLCFIWESLKVAA